jgi:hypothetical protein
LLFSVSKNNEQAWLYGNEQTAPAKDHAGYRRARRARHKEARQSRAPAWLSGPRLLKLDLAFYTADDPGIAREVISRMRVATLQVFQRPTLIIDAIKSSP